MVQSDIAMGEQMPVSIDELCIYLRLGSVQCAFAAGAWPVSDYPPQFGFAQGTGFTDTVRMACSYEKHFSFVIQVCMSVKHVV